MNKNLAVITGSSKGIGSGIVQEFLKEDNWQVLGVSRSPNQFAQNKPKFKSRYSEILCDLMDSQSLELVKKELEKTHEQFDQISIVHNFGLTDHAHILDASSEVWKSVFHANVTVPFEFTREITPFMKRGSSHIFIGSTLSTMAVPNSSAYVASKHATAGLMRATAADLASKGITSNLVCPGFTESEMAKQVVENSAKTSETSTENLQSALEAMSPLKRFLKPEEIGRFVVFLAKNPTINGEILHINAGFGLVK